MAIHFKIIARKNPQDPAAPPKYYAQAVANGKRDLEGLAERISRTTTMGVGDIYGVLKTLEEEIIYALKDGVSVELGSICDIYATVSGSGAETEADFSAASHIDKKSIRITAKAKLKKQMADVPVVRQG